MEQLYYNLLLRWFVGLSDLQLHNVLAYLKIACDIALF